MREIRDRGGAGGREGGREGGRAGIRAEHRCCCRDQALRRGGSSEGDVIECVRELTATATTVKRYVCSAYVLNIIRNWHYAVLNITRMCP